MNILNPFDNFLKEAKKFQPKLDTKSKRQSKEQIVQQGLPSRKEESWRYTSIKFLDEYNFIPQAGALDLNQINESAHKVIEEKKIPNTHCLVFVNGFYMAALSQFDTKTLTISYTSQMPSQLQVDAIQSLNELYNLQSLEIVIKNDLAKPLQIINFTQLSESREVVSSPKIKMTVKTNKEAKIVLTNVGEAHARYFSNCHFTFVAEKSSRLELVNHINQSLNSYHFDYIHIAAEAAASVRYFELNFNALLTRHEFTLDINGENVQSEILGASYLKQKQHCDSQTLINHYQGSSRSEQVYKALLDDESRSVFSGTVYIAQHIAKADSSQLNQNMLLTNQAEANSKPVLRIYSDDVKASHGSTIGQIDEDEIFYLQSRSISRIKAIEFLGQGFLNEIIFRLGSNEIKQYFSKILAHELESK